MGGRGAGGRGRSERASSRRFHLSGLSKAEALSQVRQDLINSGQDPAKAEDIVKAVHDYSDDKFFPIRAVQVGENIPPFFNKKTMQQYGDDIELYIESAPSMEGVMYRGMTTMADLEGAMTLDTLRQAYINGTPIDFRGTSSWTTDLSTARSFRGSSMRNFITPDGEEYDGQLDSFLFKVSNVPKSTSIKHLSVASQQDEVLVSKSTSFYIKNITIDRYGQGDIELEAIP